MRIGLNFWVWPVIANLLRFMVIVIGCVVLSRNESVRSEHFFWLIAAGIAVHAFIACPAIRLGAWDRGREGVASHPAPAGRAKVCLSIVPKNMTASPEAFSSCIFFMNHANVDGRSHGF